MAWGLVWATAALANALVLVRQGETTFLRGLQSAAVEYGLGAILAATVWKLAERLPQPGQRPIAFALGHAGLGASFALGWLGLWLAELWWSAGPEVARFVAQQSGWWSLLSRLFMYAGVAGVGHAVRASRALREQQVAAARAEALAANARLSAVRAQLNPHFLYNCLHSVGALIRHDPAAAEVALDRLGGLLRYSLDEGTAPDVALADEWRFAKDYLALEQVRLGDRLRLNVAIEPRALDCAVPPFLLQPLVENAVRHGVAPKPGGGSIRVEAKLVARRLILVVADDGPGADPLRAEPREGRGLKLVRQLVEAHYPGQNTMTIATAPGAGFTVTIDVPACLAGRPRAQAA